MSNWDRAPIGCGCLERFHLELLGFGLGELIWLVSFWKFKPEDGRTPLLAVLSNASYGKTIEDAYRRYKTPVDYSLPSTTVEVFGRHF